MPTSRRPLGASAPTHPPTHPPAVDGYSNPNGLGLTAADQLDYNTWLADTAHGLGLAAGLKNDIGQAKELAPKFDFFVNELCNQYNECGLYVEAGVKAGAPPLPPAAPRGSRAAAAAAAAAAAGSQRSLANPATPPPAGKPVWNIEYDRSKWENLCPQQATYGLRSIFKVRARARGGRVTSASAAHPPTTALPARSHHPAARARPRTRTRADGEP